MPEEEVKRARKDPHAKRRPRPCGITVHPGHGCPRGCVYCYIPEMGFKFERARPYPLTGEGMVLALLYNRRFEPGRTFIALGSVTDPFLPELAEKSLEYLQAFDEWLANPVQTSTKSYLEDDTIEALASLRNPPNVLVTVLTPDGEKAARLEPKAPSPSDRLKTVEKLSRAGVTVDLFLRPLLPGIIGEDEIETLMERALDAGARGVVVGGFRVNEGILRRLRNAGFDVSEIVKRARGRIPRGRRQAYIRTGDIKRRVIDLARDLGLVPFGAACCACASTFEVPCPNRCWETGFCTRCGNPACPT
ncbi:MAG: radical SAM protein [Methanopyri archaeon]|nr:radical SAM protein [Methanopyri archaeon]